MKLPLLFLLLAWPLPASFAGTRTSAAYRFDTDAVDSAGRPTTSANYAVETSVGGLAGASMGAGIVSAPGYIGQVVGAPDLLGTAATATTLAATNLTTSGATLHASVNPGGLATTVTFTLDGATAGTVDLDAGTSTVDVPLAVDHLVPGSAHTFSASASNSKGGASGTTLGFTVLTGPPGELTFASATVEANPEDDQGQPNLIVLTINRSSSTGGALTVTVGAGVPGTPVAGFKNYAYGTDYQFVSESAPQTALVSFAGGQTTATVSVRLKVSAARASGAFALTLAAPTGGATLGSPASATVKIGSRDGAAPVVKLTSPAAATVPGTFDIAGTVNDNVALDSFTVTLNGAPLLLATDPLTTFAAGADVAFRAAGVAPENGSNVIEVLAGDTSGNVTRKTKTVQFINNRAALAGIYTTLCQPTGARTNDTVGLVSVKVMATGSFSGKLTVGKRKISFSGVLSNAGAAIFKPDATAAFDLTGLTDPASHFAALAFNVGTPAGINGTISTGAGAVAASFAGKVSPYSAKNTVPAGLLNLPAQGNYTVAFFSEQQIPAVAAELYPQGDGFATLTLKKAGGISLSGSLADGTKYSASGNLRADATAPLFTQLYGKLGCLAGELAFASLADSDVTGADFIWLRPAMSRATGYRTGWPGGITVDVIGAQYASPGSLDFTQGAANPNTGNASLVFGGNLLSKAFSIDPLTGEVALIPATNKTYSLTLKPTTGLFSGTFTHPDGTRPAYRGILLNKGAIRGGFGYFINTPPASATGSQSSGMSLDPAGP